MSARNPLPHQPHAADNRVACRQEDLIATFSHSAFMQQAAAAKSVASALAFARALPPSQRSPKLYQHCIAVCRAVGSLAAAQQVLDLLVEHEVARDACAPHLPLQPLA